jgi:putative redox protein
VSGRPPVTLELTWQGGSRLLARAGDVQQALDWDSREAFSPVQALALALAGCMASDLVVILQKARLPLGGLSAHLVAQRAAEEPRRLVAVDLRFTVTGPVPVERVVHAVSLSRDRYCSVWHSLRPDIVFTTSCDVVSEPS